MLQLSEAGLHESRLVEGLSDFMVPHEAPPRIIGEALTVGTKNALVWGRARESHCRSMRACGFGRRAGRLELVA